MNTNTLNPERSVRTSESFNPSLYPLRELGRTAFNNLDDGIQAWHAYTRMSMQAARALGFRLPFAERTKQVMSATEIMSGRLAAEYPKPEFDLDHTTIAGETVAVKEVITEDKAFGSLLHFDRDIYRNDPRVLVVAPMSGHYATIVRDTVKQLLPSHDVYITDWKNARDVPLEEGDFGLDDYIEYVTDFIKKMGPDTNVVAVCQATVPTLAAISHLADVEPESQPRTMTLMAGPLDTSAAPTAVTDFADRISIDQLARNCIGKVPKGYAGAGRLVYPGFMQLAAFMSMNPRNHAKAQRELYKNLVDGEDNLASKEAARKTAAFYDEYCAVADLAAPFYLETVQRVFKDQELARGTMVFGGRKINPAAINRTAVLTIEGEKDDISAPGQTVAAHSWLAGLAPEQHYHHLQEGVGHYGVFSGTKWADEIAPRLTFFMRKMAAADNLTYDSPASDSSSPNQWQ